MLKRIRSPSRKTAHIGDQVSAHSHSETRVGAHILSSLHSSDQIHDGGGVLSSSHSLASKTTHSPSHKMAHTSNKGSTHSGGHNIILSPLHYSSLTHGDGSSLSIY